VNSKIANFPGLLGMKASRDQIRHLFIRAMEAGKWRYGRSAEMVLGGCLYLQARSESKPVTLVTVAVRLQQTLTS